MAKEKTKIIRPQEGFQEKFVRTNIDFVIGGGVLNDEPLDRDVATPYGMKKMKDIHVGDVVCDIHGGTQIVVRELYKGLNPCVEFTLDDGRKIESSLDHHWLVTKNGKKLKVTAKEIIEHIETQKKVDSRHRVNLRIPNIDYAFFKDAYKKERTIDPYVLGCMLGDGWFSKSERHVGFCNPDKFIIDKMSDLGYNMVQVGKAEEFCYRIKNDDLRDKLRALDLWEKNSHKKFIPRSYLYAPREVRFEILRGLFDTDGYCSHTDDNRYVCGYRTTSKQLAKDVEFLINSLGGKCYVFTTPETIRKRRRDSDKEMHCSESYGFRVQMPNNKELYHLPRKKNNAQEPSERKVSPYMSIKSYQLTGLKETKCIQVSGDEHLYVTDRFIMTCNCGKSYSAVLSVAEPSKDGRFRGLFLRNNLADARASGGLLDTFKEVYGNGNGCEVVESGEPRVTFPSGAKIDVTHVADQSRDKVLQRFKGRQYDFIYFDEGTGFTWQCFTAIYSRNRGTAAWTGKVRMTTNPDRDHWLRQFLDWYIGIDGFIREDREGVVRYFFMAGETVKDVVWGDSKEEVYNKCKIQIDRILYKVNGKTGTATYKDIIKSFTFYLGRMSENKASIGNNSGYVGSVAITGGRNAQQLLEGNWNVSVRDALDAPIPQDLANQVFLNDPCINGDKWVTCDLADTGNDNFLCLAWDGFHVFDALILGDTTPRQNAECLEMFAAQHGISNSHIIYDAIRGTYINDYIPEAIQFVSYRAPLGMYGRMAYHLKDECYMRLVEMIKRNGISFADNIGLRKYDHKNMSEDITIQNEFIEECSVVRFKDMQSGKKTLYSKKEMNQKLGKGRSMDLLDPCAMRMLPVLQYAYGDELIETAKSFVEESSHNRPNGFDIYEDSNWC